MGFSANSEDFDQVNQACLTLRTLDLPVDWPRHCDDGLYSELSDRRRCRRSGVCDNRIQLASAIAAGLSAVIGVGAGAGYVGGGLNETDLPSCMMQFLSQDQPLKFG